MPTNLSFAQIGLLTVLMTSVESLTVHVWDACNATDTHTEAVSYPQTCSTAPTPSTHPRCQQNAPEGLDEAVWVAALAEGISPVLLSSVVIHESGCNPDAVGTSGEIGLAQVNPSVWVTYLIQHGIIHEKKDLFDPPTNLRAAAHILRLMQDLSGGSVQGTLRRYNGSGKKAREYGYTVHNLYGEILHR